MITDSVLIVMILFACGVNVKFLHLYIVQIIDRNSAGATFGSWVLAITIPLNVWFVLTYFTRLLS